MVAVLTTQYDVKHRKTTPYNPKTNGLSVRANRIICKILIKVVISHKTDCDRKLTSVVYVYNTAHKSTTARTSYYLVFGQEVIQFIETEVETLRVHAAKQGNRTKRVNNRLDDIDQLEEDQMNALERTKAILSKRKQVYDKRITLEKGIEEGGLILLYDSQYKNFLYKLHTRWMGPYRMDKIYSNGLLQLSDLGQHPLDIRVNGSRVKLYRLEDVREDPHE